MRSPAPVHNLMCKREQVQARGRISVLSIRECEKPIAAPFIKKGMPGKIEQHKIIWLSKSKAHLRKERFYQLFRCMSTLNQLYISRRPCPPPLY